jgi:phosphoglycolate phosphatase-like HAD superfamily hydrolase
MARAAGAGLAIGVLTGTSSRVDLAEADALIEHLEELLTPDA